eukprot:6064133-Pyramimonas_sp.AAC.1
MDRTSCDIVLVHVTCMRQTSKRRVLLLPPSFAPTRTVRHGVRYVILNAVHHTVSERAADNVLLPERMQRRLLLTLKP